jgi:hypothetical protein
LFVRERERARAREGEGESQRERESAIARETVGERKREREESAGQTDRENTIPGPPAARIQALPTHRVTKAYRS